MHDQLKDVQQIHASEETFAAILQDGSVVTWGSGGSGGDSGVVQHQLKNVQQIQASEYAFAAILADGSVVAWGNPYPGGNMSMAVRDQLQDVQQIQANTIAFAAILADGSVATWGDALCGGDSSAVQDQLKNVHQIQANICAFAAILGDGSIVTWGNVPGGGGSQVKKAIQATSGAFPSIEADAFVGTFCSTAAGGYSFAVQDQLGTKNWSWRQRTSLGSYALGFHISGLVGMFSASVEELRLTSCPEGP